MAMDSDIVFICNKDQDFIKASGGRGGFSEQVIPLHIHIYSSTFLHNNQAVLLLFLSHLSTTNTDIVVAPAEGRLQG